MTSAVVFWGSIVVCSLLAGVAWWWGDGYR